MATPTVIADSGDAVTTSIAAAVAPFAAALPKIVAFALILAIGWFLATAVGKLVAKVLRSVHFNDLADRAGVSGFVRSMGSECDASGWLGGIAKWFIRLIAAVVAFDALGLPAVSEVLRQLLLWLPNLVVALVVLVIGGVLARAARGIVQGSTQRAGFSSPQTLGTIAYAAVWAFAIVVAVQQIGVAQTLVNTLFMAVVGAMALALGLAFGLGGRETAAEIIRRAYRATEEAAPKIQRATEEAANQAQGYTGGERRSTPRGMQPGYGDD